MYTRTDGLRGVQEAEDRRQYVARDQDEVRMMFLSMRATRDAARRGEHVAGWRLDAGRGAILRECPCPAVSVRSVVSASRACPAASLCAPSAKRWSCVLTSLHRNRRGGVEGSWATGCSDGR